MKGVNYPVLGIDDLGNQQMMMPGQDYKFPGNYVTEIPQMGKGGLRQWFAEEWTDVKTGKPCGRSGKDKDGRPYPACRPSKRVNETTPKTTSEMSSAEKDKFKREKTSGKRIDYNHKRREFGGESWLNQYQDGGTEQNPERMQGVDIKRKRKNVSDSPKYQYDNKGNLLYTPELNIYPYLSDNSSRDSFWVTPKIPIQNLNPTVEELRTVAAPYYPIDNKLVSDPKLTFKYSEAKPSNYQESLEQEYVLPQVIGKSFGNLPLVKDDGYSPNRRWITSLRNGDKLPTGYRYNSGLNLYGSNNYAYVLKTDPNNLVNYSTKDKIENDLSLNDKALYDYLAKINYSPDNVYGLTRELPDQIWNRAEQMRVEMRNNPEIMSWANLHNVDLGYKERYEDSEDNDDFAPKIPESIYAARSAEAGLPTNRPDYDYGDYETYIAQDPSKFNLVDYFPVAPFLKDARNNEETNDQALKKKMAKRMGIDPSAFDSGEYLIHYNKTPITEYTPGKKYGGWLDQFQNGSEVPSDIERMDPAIIKRKRSWFDKLKGYIHRGEKAIGLDPYNERSDDMFSTGYFGGKEGLIPDEFTDNKPTLRQLKTYASLYSPKNWVATENSFEPLTNYNEYNSFDEAFTNARKNLGRGKSFLYDGKRHITSYKGEAPDEESDMILEILKGNLSKEQQKRLDDVYTNAGQPPLTFNRDDEKFYVPGLNTGLAFSNFTIPNHGYTPHVNLISRNTPVYLGIPEGEINDIRDVLLDELSHNMQVRRDGTGVSIARFLTDASLGKLGNFNPYARPTMFEGEAHSVIAPKLKKYVEQGNKFQTGGWANFVPASSTPLLRKDVSGNAGYRDNTRVNTINPATKKAAEAAQYARRVGSISQGKTKSDYEKAREASSFVSQAEQRKGSADPLDYVLDIVNPATYGFAGTDLVGNTAMGVNNLAKGNFSEAAGNALNAGMNALYLAPAVAELRGPLNTLSNSIYKGIPKAFLNKSEAELQKQAGVDWLRNWYSQPEIKQRFNQQIYNPAVADDLIMPIYKKNVVTDVIEKPNSTINLNKSAASDFASGMSKEKYAELKYGFRKDPIVSLKYNEEIPFAHKKYLGVNSGYGNNMGGYTNVYPEHPEFFYSKFNPFSNWKPTVKGTTIHEGTHWLTTGDQGLAESTKQMFREPFDISKRISKHDKYLTKPTEVHARLNELRSQYNLGPTVTQSQVDKIISDGLKGKTNVQSRFFELLKDNKSLTNLFNTAMGISAPIAAASQLQEQKQGGQTSWLNKYK
jgi:hypothetical protein